MPPQHLEITLELAQRRLEEPRLRLERAHEKQHRKQRENDEASCDQGADELPVRVPVGNDQRDAAEADCEQRQEQRGEPPDEQAPCAPQLLLELDADEINPRVDERNRSAEELAHRFDEPFPAMSVVHGEIPSLEQLLAPRHEHTERECESGCDADGAPRVLVHVAVGRLGPDARFVH